ncbi:SPOR domain-containing protein [candidate division TA06 bacterium]|uniref:SPOR domain-containing protein n=1 Tax=candidate division TA06 bacterium TaxID=2250710 RepID=A0A933IBF7_UNCT6|nr:SPOR domain-containing protein [candidate division TA06 bacterium]
MKHKILLAVALPLLLAGCFGNKQEVQKPLGEPVAEAPAKTPFPEQPPVPAPAPQDNSGMTVLSGSKGPVQQVYGWRVQLFVSGSIENARRVAEEARWKFEDQQIYISESLPYYKVQAGNCLTRQDADNLKTRAKVLGYQGSFVVEMDLTR